MASVLWDLEGRCVGLRALDFGVLSLDDPGMQGTCCLEVHG